MLEINVWESARTDMLARYVTSEVCCMQVQDTQLVISLCRLFQSVMNEEAASKTPCGLAMLEVQVAPHTSGNFE